MFYRFQRVTVAYKISNDIFSKFACDIDLKILKGSQICTNKL